MARVFYIHFNRDEALPVVRTLRDAGHTVRFHFSTEEAARLDPLPNTLVISLERLPSHGRRYAQWFWEAKKRRSIPIVFVGGAEEKVAVARREFPDARFCNANDLVETLAKCFSPGAASVPPVTRARRRTTTPTPRH